MARLTEKEYHNALAKLDLYFENTDAYVAPDLQTKTWLLELVELVNEYENEHFPVAELPEGHPKSDASDEVWDEWEKNNPFDPFDEFRP